MELCLKLLLSTSGKFATYQWFVRALWWQDLCESYQVLHRCSQICHMGGVLTLDLTDSLAHWLEKMQNIQSDTFYRTPPWFVFLKVASSLCQLPRLNGSCSSAYQPKGTSRVPGKYAKNLWSIDCVIVHINKHSTKAFSRPPGSICTCHMSVTRKGWGSKRSSSM